jgi:hypothetical protein
MREKTRCLASTWYHYYHRTPLSTRAPRSTSHNHTSTYTSSPRATPSTNRCFPIFPPCTSTILWVFFIWADLAKNELYVVQFVKKMRENLRKKKARSCIMATTARGWTGRLIPCGAEAAMLLCGMER